MLSLFHDLIFNCKDIESRVLSSFVMQQKSLIKKDTKQKQKKNLTQLYFREKLVNVNKSFVIIRAERDERLKLHETIPQWQLCQNY